MPWSLRISAFAFEIPIRIRSAANLREHWAVKARRVKSERLATRLCWRMAQPPALPFPLVVTLTRIAPRELDDDNLRSALKGVRDQLADELGLKSDRDPRVRWAYAQTKGKPKQYAVRVDVRSEAGCGQCAAGSLEHESCGCECHARNRRGG